MNAEELTLLKSLRKDAERLEKARGVLREHDEMLGYLRQNIDRITPQNTDADPKNLQLLLDLADALEPESEAE